MVYSFSKNIYLANNKKAPITRGLYILIIFLKSVVLLLPIFLLQDDQFQFDPVAPDSRRCDLQKPAAGEPRIPGLADPFDDPLATEKSIGGISENGFQFVDHAG